MSFRQPLVHSANESFTMKRDEHQQLEDLRLVKDFAAWLASTSRQKCTEETFEEDLKDGVILCNLMSKINGSGLTVYHPRPSGSFSSLDDFKSRENLVSFQLACDNLRIPISFGMEDLEKKNITRVVSSLIFIAHTAYRQGNTVIHMNEELLKKVEEMDRALMSSQLSWLQQLLLKFGLGDWVYSLNMDALKRYIEGIKETVKDKIEIQQEKILEKTNSLKEYLPQAIKSRLE